MSKHQWKTRVSAVGLAILAAYGGAMPAAAVQTVGNGVAPTYDEAYYATLDYYGNLTNGSVVKSYRTNGATQLTDYGQYDEVVNLTDGTAPLQSGGRTTFRFSEDVGTFYFEGKTAQPFADLPWTLSVSYTLNGVPTPAEELAGKTGVVEITLDAVPNPQASEYARNNYTLEAMAIFNQDDILSLEAPGAQVQLIGNLRAVLFLGLPGEECHDTIRVGSEDFSFGGLTVMMVPATLSQLEEVAKLSERKDELEDDYHKLSGSLDSLLDALNAMTGSLNASASGLDQLNEARGIFSGGKGTLYDGTDALRQDLSDLAEVLDPVEGQIEALSKTVTDSKAVLNNMSKLTGRLRDDLEELEDALDELEQSGDLRGVLNAAGRLGSSLNDLQTALGGTKLPTVEVSGSEGTELKMKMSQVKRLHGIYADAYRSGTAEDFFTAMMQMQGKSAGEIAAALPVLAATMQAVQAGAVSLEQVRAQDPAAALLIGLYLSRGTTSFQSFCEKVLPVSYPDRSEEEIRELARQANNLWLVYESGESTSATALEEEEGTLTAALLLNDSSPDAADAASSDAPETTDSATTGGAGAADTSDASGGADAPDTADGQDGTVSAAPEGQDADTAADAPNEKANDAAVDLIASGVDKAASQIKDLQTEIHSTMQSLATATAPVLRDLSKLCTRLNALTEMLDTGDDLLLATQKASHEIRAILQAAEELQTLLDGYEPTLQESLKTVGALSATAAVTMKDTQKLVTDAENLMRSTGAALDEGTRRSLEGLASVLRGAARAAGTSGEIKSSKATICDIVEDTWDDYTGDVNNLLLMDATAEAVSLTDSRNPAPQSVQVLIRTQEITMPDEEDEVSAAPQAEKTTFWGRVAQMFKDYWAAITGLFGGKD